MTDSRKVHAASYLPVLYWTLPGTAKGAAHKLIDKYLSSSIETTLCEDVMIVYYTSLQNHTISFASPNITLSRRIELDVS